MAALREAFTAAGLEAVVALSAADHHIENPDPVTLLTGFKPLGPCLATMDKDGSVTLVVTPAWDEGRAQRRARCDRLEGCDDLLHGLARLSLPSAERVGFCGCDAMPHGVIQALAEVLGGLPRPADGLVFAIAARKTDAEIENARHAARIAEAGYAHLLAVARPGMAECDLAVELRLHMEALGAEDNFLMLTSASHPRAVQPSGARRLQAGDLIIAELTPSVGNQFAQICRTATLGRPPPVLAEKYALLVETMQAGIGAARAGARMAEVAWAMDRVLEEAGYSEFCRPPHMNRRGHGLGMSSILPGNVVSDNDTVLEEDMVFVIHPNQYLPETGYLLCGEPVMVTAEGGTPLTETPAALGCIPV